MKRINRIHWLSLLGALILAGTWALASDGAGGHDAITENSGEQQQTDNPCLVFGSLALPRHNAQLFAIDPKASATQLVGEAIASTDVSGLAVHPHTLEVYALQVRQRGAKTTSLMRLDKSSGALDLIGPISLEHVEGLSFRPGDASLWAWWRDHGLIQIDPVTANVQLIEAADLPVSALAWDPEGDVLYLAGNRSLWTYVERFAGFRLLHEPLPVLVGGMAIRRDGQLLLSAANTGTTGLDLLVFDPASGQVVTTFGVPALPIDSGRARDRTAAFVKSLSWPMACGNASPGGPAELIQNVELDPPALCSGDSSLVRVETSHPEGDKNPVLVNINGLAGAERSLQFEGLPGPRLVNVSASTAEGYVDGGTWEVEVIDCGPVQPVARLSVGMNPYHPYLVDFLVDNAVDVAPEGTQYEWDFGDGLTETTSVPFVSHSYKEALLPERERVSFQAAVTLRLPDGTSLQAPKTVSIWNAYAGSRKHGLIQPLLTYDPELISSDAQLVGKYTLRNLEEAPIVFTRRRVDLQPCDPELDPDPASWEAISLMIEPGAALEDSLVLDAALVPEHVCSVELHLAGEFGPVDRVAADLYFEIKRDPLSFAQVTDPATLATLADVVERGLVEDPDLISDEELYQLSHAGMVEMPLPGVSAAAPAQGLTEEPPDCETDPLQIGCPCERGDVPDDPSGSVGDISCQATEVFASFPAHLPNALKGDVILVGGCGFVGELLSVLDQEYVHTGIMTRNYTEIAHSTSTEARADNHLVWPPHIDPAVLRYGWPGVIRSDVDAAFSAVHLEDNYGDEYVLTDFNAEPARCPGMEIVPPLVVKPPPDQAAAVRPLLWNAADLAREMATPVDAWNSPDHDQWGTGNYRFFAYTDATIVDDSSFNYPGDEPATVCSAFVWHVLKSAGANLEGPGLEPVEMADDWSHGGVDGLYHYPADKRLEAGRSMWDNVHEAVMEMSLFDPLFDVVADGIANQLVNCFASDQCDNEDTAHRDWEENPGDGTTVSPDNILLWDPPTDEDGDGVIDYGVYGHSERLVLRSGGYKRLYRWAPSEGTGTVAGQVFYQDGTPAPGATVILDGRETVSGPGGQYEFLAVPAGAYVVEAQKQDETFLSASEPVTALADQKVKVDLVLLPPADEFRLVRATGIYALVDQEVVPVICIPQVQFTGGDIDLACRVDPYDPPDSTYETVDWYESLGDTDLSLEMRCFLLPENKVKVLIYSDLDGQDGAIQHKTLLPGESYTFETVNLSSKDKWAWCGSWWDKAGFDITISNEVQEY
jgi:hypothetical protein